MAVKNVHESHDTIRKKITQKKHVHSLLATLKIQNHLSIRVFYVFYSKVTNKMMTLYVESIPTSIVVHYLDLPGWQMKVYRDSLLKM